MIKYLPTAGRARAFLLALGVIAAFFATACSLTGGNDEDTSGEGDASSVRVRRVILETDLGPLAVRNIVPTSSRLINPRVELEGVEPGMIVLVRWYQLGVRDVGPEGTEIEVGASEVMLTADKINVDVENPQGETFITFTSLTSGPSGFPEDAWLLRIFVNGELVRTVGFVVTSALDAAVSPPTQPTAVPPVEAVPTPINYTVVAGDTLQLVAQRFLPEGETLPDFLVRIGELNDISVSAILQTGQVLLIPGPK